MGRYHQLFQSLASKREGAFVPFVVLGDPDFETSKQILETLVESGADALELGIPFSDPLADGPEIQRAVIRAFDSGINVTRCFELIRYVRAKYPELPIGLLMYANLVFSNGIENFYARCYEAGVDSVLVADVPIREYKPYYEAALKNKIDPVLICPPNATEETLTKIAEYGRGYTYLLSRAGVTGMEMKAEYPLDALITRLEELGAPAAIQGFGIGTPEQAQYFLNSGVKGVISGSAVVQIIRDHIEDKTVMLTKLREFIASMKAATTL